MLILTRRIGETLTIGDDIKITVLGLNGRQIRLGIRARRKRFPFIDRKCLTAYVVAMKTPIRKAKRSDIGEVSLLFLLWRIPIDVYRLALCPTGPL